MRYLKLPLLLGAACGSLLGRAAAADIDTPLRLQELEARLEARWTGAPSAAAAKPLARWLPGASAFAATTLASVDEVIDVGRRRAYDQASFSAGLRVPLLGSRAAQLESMRGRELERQALEATLLVSQQKARADLRRAYIALWSGETRRELAAQYLAANVKLDDVLRKRTHAGLLLESDRREFMTSISAVAVDLERAAAEAEAAREVITSLVDLRPVRVAEPRLHNDCTVASSSAARRTLIVNAHPEVITHRARLAALAARDSIAWLKPLQSDVRLGMTRSYEPTSGERGHSAFVGLSLEYAFQSAAAERDLLRVQRAAATAELAQTRSRIEAEAGRLLALERSWALAARHARSVVSAAETRLRERSLRMAHLAGDRIEQQQQARYELHRARWAEHLARREWLEWQVALAEIDFSACDSSSIQSAANADLLAATAAGDTRAGAASRARTLRGMYLWSSREFIDQTGDVHSASHWDRFTDFGIERLMVSLDREQIARYSVDPAPLARMLDVAHARGMRVELLLGEPTWILPQHRDDLLTIIASLSGLQFDGLHLDLEPNQLDVSGGDGREHLPALLDTLAQAATLAPWPVSLSVHPRYMTLRVDEREFGEHLNALAITPSLMIYIADIERIEAIAAPLAARWPGLGMRVAVSLEPDLDPQHSFAHLPRVQAQRSLNTLHSRLSRLQFAGLDLQPASTEQLGAEHSPETP